MRKKTSLLSIAMLSAAVSIAQNFTAVYTFDSVKTTTGLIDPTLPPIAIGVAFGSFSATGTPANPSAAKIFSFKNWPTGSVDGDSLYSQLTGSLNTSEYYEVTIGPENGYTLDLSSITFGVLRSSTGIRTYTVRSSVDGYAANLSASINPTNAKLSVQMGDIFFWSKDATTTNQNGSTITLGGTNYTGISSPVTFRFYGYNSEGSVGTFGIDNVTFTGVASVATAIANTVSADEITIYPNPSVTGMFMIDLGNVVNGSKIIVRNILGAIIFTKEVNASQNKIDLSDAANGSYFLTIENNKVISTRKIIINK